MKTADLPLIVAQLAQLPRAARARGGNTANARLALNMALARASTEARQRLTRTLEIQGLHGPRADQVPQNPWPAFEAGLLGGPPRIAELLPPQARADLVRRFALGHLPPRSEILEETTEVLAWRKDQKALWAKHIAVRDDYLADAMKHGATAAKAAEAAGKHVRGDVRVFIGNLLVRAPASAVATFIADGPRDWGIATERLLDTGELVPRLVDAAFPKPEWSKQIDEIDKAKAELDSSWRGYVDSALGVLGDAAGTAKDAVWGVGSTVGEAVTDVSGGVGDFLGGLGKGLSWLPIGLGVLGVGAVAVVVARSSARPRREPDRPELPDRREP